MTDSMSKRNFLKVCLGAVGTIAGASALPLGGARAEPGVQDQQGDASADLPAPGAVETQYQDRRYRDYGRNYHRRRYRDYDRGYRRRDPYYGGRGYYDDRYRRRQPRQVCWWEINRWGERVRRCAWR